MEAPDFTPVVVLAYVGLAVVIGGPVVGIAWLVWRFVR